ncbi:MAG: hypothetical protein DRN30_02515 [Thermoplasmata archaeon]|nr:MAG: hypothetical protein DRN30_02515 [Thermoplasmata archaeon]
MTKDLERFIITTTWGLEDLTAEEVESFGGNVIEILPGKVLAEAPFEFMYVANYILRTAEKVYIYLTHDKFKTLEDIKAIVEDIDLSKYISGQETFGVKTKRFGNHSFTSIDVNKIVGEIIQRKYRLNVYLDNPDLEIKTWVIEDVFIMGINTTGYSLYRRGYRIYQHPAPLKPTISSLLLKLAGWKPQDPLVDPMCGSGTILIEAALMARNIPPGYFRPYYQFYRFKFFDRSFFEEIKRTFNKRIHWDLRIPLYGIELYKNHLYGAISNATMAKVIDTISFLLGDARKLCQFLKFDVDYVVTNPPYGLKIASKRTVYELYERFVTELDKCLSGATIVVMTAEEYFWTLIKDSFKILEVREIMYGELPTKIYKFKV